jgi:hypothetical protein
LGPVGVAVLPVFSVAAHYLKPASAATPWRAATREAAGWSVKKAYKISVCLTIDQVVVENPASLLKTANIIVQQILTGRHLSRS